MFYFISFFSSCIDSSNFFFRKRYISNFLKSLEGFFGANSKGILRWIFVYVIKDESWMNLTQFFFKK
ncbi:hypothetical protein C7N77_16170 [Aeromonas rivipollensis]|nr:hypothetical protein C7N77_16170 [Aeromonas rivipollensis]